jgi:hypothetical protein
VHPNGDTIGLLENLTFVGAEGDSWSTDWIPFPPNQKELQLAVQVKTRMGDSSVLVEIETSFDTTDMASTIGVNVTATNPGVSIGPATPLFLGPLVRLRLTAQPTVQNFSAMILSAWLTPKQAKW